MASCLHDLKDRNRSRLVSRWRFIEPGPGLFELPRQPEQGRFIAPFADEVHANGQTFIVPVQWHGHGGLTGDVENRRPRDEFKRLRGERFDDSHRVKDPGLPGARDELELCLFAR